jgi:hypothetical protein
MKEMMNGIREQKDVLGFQQALKRVEGLFPRAFSLALLARDRLSCATSCHSSFNFADNEHPDQAQQGRPELKLIRIGNHSVEGIDGEQELKEKKGFLFHGTLQDGSPKARKASNVPENRYSFCGPAACEAVTKIFPGPEGISSSAFS